MREYRIIKNKDLKKYILDRVEKDSTTGCWNWKLFKDKRNYGGCSLNIGYGKKNYKAHRISYLFFKGEIPNGLFVCHKCDNPSCCNPEHLFLGTALENNHDMIKKGRFRGGENPQYGNNNRGKKVLAGGIIFKNFLEAGKYFGISDNGIRKRIQLKWKGYEMLQN